jgi:hypothetical protein
MKSAFAAIGAIHIATITFAFATGLFTDRAATCRPAPLFEIARSYRNGWKGQISQDALHSFTTNDLIAVRDAACRVISHRTN